MYTDTINNNTNTTTDSVTPDTTQSTDATVAATKTMTTNFMVLLQEALQMMCDSGNRQQVSDANEELLCQQYETELNDSGTKAISGYINANSTKMDDKTVQTNISTYQTELSTRTSTSDGITHAMETSLETDGNHIDAFVDMASPIHTILGYTSNILGH